LAAERRAARFERFPQVDAQASADGGQRGERRRREAHEHADEQHVDVDAEGDVDGPEGRSEGAREQARERDPQRGPQQRPHRTQQQRRPQVDDRHLASPGTDGAHDRDLACLLGHEGAHRVGDQDHRREQRQDRDDAEELCEGLGVRASVDEEMSGRLTQVLAQPARRATLFAGRVVIGGVAVLAAGVIAGLFAWLGAKLQGVDPGFGRMLGAGTNLVPTALVVFGIGAVVRSIAPRLATAAVYGVVGWSYVADLLGSLVDGTRWLQHASVFRYMALAPAESIDATAVAVTLLVAAALLASATLLFVRRDIRAT
jgi:hypothetical protein